MALRLPVADLYLRRAVALTFFLWLFVGVIYLPILIERHRGGSWSSVALDFSTVLVSMLVALPLYLVFRATIDWPVWRRGLVISASVAVAAVGQTVFDFQFTNWVASNLQSTWSALPRDIGRFYGAMFNYACVFGVNVALFNLSASRIRAMEGQRDLAAARSAAQQALLAALRFQLNPHFLFNTLNAISAMIVTRRNDEAEQMMEKLCAFLRASLSSDVTAVAPLEEELSLVQDYLDIEKVRFGDRLRVSIEATPEAEETLFPSLLLQPLVENAVKYGVSRSRAQVVVSISARVEGRVLRVAVDDDARPDADAGTGSGTGTGQVNVRRRLDALYGADASLLAGAHAGGYRAMLELPARRAVA